jgi:fido (protein-threonine AMPylation protein)
MTTTTTTKENATSLADRLGYSVDWQRIDELLDLEDLETETGWNTSERAEIFRALATQTRNVRIY